MTSSYYLSESLFYPNPEALLTMLVAGLLSLLSVSSPAWLRASNAMPAVNAPSPITAIARRSWPWSLEASAIPIAALIDVLECPTPNASYSLSSRAGKAAGPSWPHRHV